MAQNNGANKAVLIGYIAFALGLPIGCGCAMLFEKNPGKRILADVTVLVSTEQVPLITGDNGNSGFSGL